MVDGRGVVTRSAVQPKDQAVADEKHAEDKQPPRIDLIRAIAPAVRLCR